ncbi:MAG: glycosyltransferase family 8 protein [Endomicrobium sp.]|jgi:lipopolysaccharide biosynthesis glycosyltransferase|nr:glycosyltransferase family 8 protein [Endomicrobium sp.]
MNNRGIKIAFGVDDKYAKHCGATIASILSNHKIENNNYKITFFLIGHLTNENKRKFISLKKIQDFEIEFIEVNEEQFKDLPIFKTDDSKIVSLANYYRLLIPELLPTEIEKVIYLDCDIIANEDISKLWNININNYLAGCVEIGQRYFNSGVMVLNLYELRKFNFHDKWKEYVEKNIDKIECYDQTILNAVIGHNILFLPTNWNLYYKNYNQVPYDKHKIDKYIEYNYIIHYIESKPWNPLCQHPLKSLYIKYAKMTDWEENLNFSFYTKSKSFAKIFLKYWAAHPLFLLNIKFWKAVKKRGLLLELY